MGAQKKKKKVDDLYGIDEGNKVNIFITIASSNIISLLSSTIPDFDT